MDNAFRKIDIDAYDEDVLQEEELFDADPRDPAQVLDDAKQRQSAVRSALARSDVVGALNTVLENAPYGPNVEEAKTVTLQTLLTILNTTKATEIPAVIKALSQDGQDTLMKYLYKGMAMPAGAISAGACYWGGTRRFVVQSRRVLFLIIVPQLTEVAGTGCIVRTMTDRRTV
ncbi:arp2/3 complex 16 kDa subunit [Mycena olivaceomarginata]|nr:arp2/3 complex 16 kDa subunit [Mycena olivaceomarginata]